MRALCLTKDDRKVNNEKKKEKRFFISRLTIFLFIFSPLNSFDFWMKRKKKC